MQLDWRHYDTGWGELLCFVAAWALGLGGLWLDYSSGPSTRGDGVAAKAASAQSESNFD